MPKLTIEDLAKVLTEEFHTWGDIEPYLFSTVATGIDREADNYQEAKAMKAVLKRVVDRLNSGRIYARR